jgi:hypothetical protein
MLNLAITSKMRIYEGDLGHDNGQIGTDESMDEDQGKIVSKVSSSTSLGARANKKHTGKKTIASGEEVFDQE